MAISPQQLKIYLTSAHRAVIFAIAQLSCYFYLSKFFLRYFYFYLSKKMSKTFTFA